MNGNVNVPGASAADLAKVKKAADDAAASAAKAQKTITVVPSQAGTLIYTGEEQSPVWNNYDENVLTLGGVTTGTDVGTYEATFTPNEGYQWNDGTTGAKNAVWTITKTESTTLVHTCANNVHILTGLDGKSGIISMQFKATEGFAEGDTFTIDGTEYIAQQMNGEALSDGFFAAGAAVSCVVDTESRVVNFKGGGGVKLPKLDSPAAEEEVFEGQEYIDETGAKRVGTFTIEDELAEQAAIITELEAALEEKAPLLPTLSNPATEAEILLGYEAIDAAGKLLTGTADPYKLKTGTLAGSGTGNAVSVTVDGTIDFALATIVNGSQTFIWAICPTKTSLQNFHNAGNHATSAGTASVSGDTFKYTSTNTNVITYYLFYK